MQLILGTGLSGVLTCVVYAKLTRPEKMTRDGVGFSKKAVICLRDGRLCLMFRVWDLNYDHIISSEFSAHFINTHRTKEGEVIRYHAQTLPLHQRQFLLWPVTLVHEIDEHSPLYKMTPKNINEYR
nr:inward rectifier potassium channel irk-1-like [Danaus plexippus plexippus]